MEDTLQLRTISDLVREMEQNDETGFSNSSKYVKENMREDINTTLAYENSVHISGPTDEQGREKPFFNICIADRNVWFRATDLDRKNINIIATEKEQVVPALLATIKLHDWMRKANFGKFLNDWGLSLATHGSSILKFIERDGELICRVMDWSEMIVDPIDFWNNIKIEKLYLTAAQLRENKSYNQDIVEKLIRSSGETRKTSDGKDKDAKSQYFCIYEVHGNLPLFYLTGKEADKTIYTNQIHVLNFQEKHDDKDDFNEYALYSGREKKDPYFLTHLIEKKGKTYAGGAIKNLFNAQWMVNHSQKLILDQLELASKLLFQTSDDSFEGKNALINLLNGDILNHKVNEPLTMLNNKADIVALQAYKNDWQAIKSQINGVSEGMLGEQPKAGTAWRSLQAQLQENHSLFELMTENKALDLETILRTYVIPFIKKQLNTKEAIVATLERHIKEIDERYLPAEINRRMNQKKKDVILNGEIYDPAMEQADMAQVGQEVQGELTGKQRFILPGTEGDWKEVLKDLEWKLEIDITGEAKDVQGILGTLTTVFQTLASNPAVLQDDNIRTVFGKILSLSGGISPLELTKPTQQLNQPQPTPQMAMASGK